MSNFIKFRPVGAEMFFAYGRTDGQTDKGKDRHDQPNSRSSQFC